MSKIRKRALLCQQKKKWGQDLFEFSNLLHKKNNFHVPRTVGTKSSSAERTLNNYRQQNFQILPSLNGLQDSRDELVINNLAPQRFYCHFQNFSSPFCRRKEEQSCSVEQNPSVPLGCGSWRSVEFAEQKYIDIGHHSTI